MVDQKKHWDNSAKLGNLASVIDPNDTKGFKNQYIAYLRDEAIRSVLPHQKILVMDFGCGSGNLCQTFASGECYMVGIDISFNLLKLAVQQNDPDRTAFIQYDGTVPPFKDGCFDYIITYGVLIHIVDNGQLTEILKKLKDLLKKDGKCVFIEQTRRFSTHTQNNFKYQRNVSEMAGLFHDAGLNTEKIEHLRRARFPLIYLIRYGLIPARYFKQVAKLDGFFARCFNKPVFSYVDTMFVLKKSS